MWFRKKKSSKEHYSKDLIEHVVKRIIKETVDREILSSLMTKELEPIVGKSVINSFFIKMNKLEKESDKRKINYWMRIAREANEKEIFDD